MISSLGVIFSKEAMYSHEVNRKSKTRSRRGKRK